MTKAEDFLVHEHYHFRRKHSFYEGRKSRGVYELDKIEDALGEKRRKSLSSLTLSKVKQANISDEEESPEEKSDEERPFTPINESIRSTPKTYHALCRHVRRRINPRPHWKHISVENQQSVGAVLLGEVNAIWSGFRRQVDDPFLTPKQNRELQRRITVHIVTVCEQLFLYYCEQVKVLNARGVFSEDANLSRIRGEVATSAGKYLNLLAVRRHIIEDLHRAEEQDSMKLGKVTDPITPETPKTPTRLSFHNLIETTRAKKSVSNFNLASEIRDMKKQMPVLDVSKVYSLIPLSRMQERLEEEEAPLVDDLKSFGEHFPKPTASFQQVKKWDSEPMLATEILPEAYSDDEFVEPPSMYSLTRLKQSSIVFTSLKNRDVQSARLSKSSGLHLPSPPLVDATDPKEDLKNLIRLQAQVEVDVDMSEDEIGIPPLIQAITRREIQDAKLQRLRQEGEELDARKREFEEEERKPLPEPKYPQPAVVQSEIPGHANPVNKSNVTIRASDMYVPDKVQLPPVSLAMNGPLSNDLTGEISPATVKELDANLFQGEELKEVYHEIMKTVPDDHLMFDSDDLVMKPVEKVNLNKTLASSTLTLPKQQRIINPKLKKISGNPPWTGEPQELWERNGKPQSVGTLSVGRSTHPSGFHPMHLGPHAMALKAHASWLAWWRATINTDDYFKYLSTKDTDFLSVIYHFYDSEISETEVDVESKLNLLEENRKREDYEKELKAKKEKYIPGLWNVNVVTLGGLGKYPEMQDDPQDTRFDTPIEDDDQMDSENSLTTFSRKIALNRLREGSRLKMNTPVDSSDDESSSRCSSKMPQISSGIQLVEQDSEKVTSGRMKEGAVSLSSSKQEESFFSISEGVAPTPSSGKVDAKEIIKSTSKDNSESDILTVRSSLSVSQVSKVIFSNIQSKHFSEDRTSGYQSNENLNTFNNEIEDGGLRRRSSRQGVSTHLGDPTGLQLTTVYYLKEWKRLHHGQKLGPTPNLLKGYYRGRSLKPGSERATKSIFHDTSGSASGTTTSPRESSSLARTEFRVSRNIQSRLETVWRKLRMSTTQKLNAAAKYSSDKYIYILDQVLSSWERVTDLVQQREHLLHDLELFELEASNPHRFFYKGAKGSSINRLHEAKARARFYQNLEKVEKNLTPMLHAIHAQYDDIVTLEGRPYHEKMNVDKIEMLYWLQQERRAVDLDKFGEPEQLKQFIRDNHVTVSDDRSPTPRVPLPILHVTIDQKT